MKLSNRKGLVTRLKAGCSELFCLSVDVLLANLDYNWCRRHDFTHILRHWSYRFVRERWTARQACQWESKTHYHHWCCKHPLLQRCCGHFRKLIWVSSLGYCIAAYYSNHILCLNSLILVWYALQQSLHLPRTWL